jgi:hypothetical protein
MKAARFGRVKNTLTMGFGMYQFDCDRVALQGSTMI